MKRNLNSPLEQLSRHRCLTNPATAFTLTELLVVIAILALLAATQLPALTGAKAPVSFTQCMNNLRQIGQAAMLYLPENNDCYPYSTAHAGGPGTGSGSVVDPEGWPMELLRYLGNNTNQPVVYRCPSESGTAPGWVFQLHYTANRMVVADSGDLPQAVRGAQVKKPSIYWLIMEKNVADTYSIRPGGLANPILAAWNVPPGSPGFRRHSGGFNATACDGHVEWLRSPPYQPGRPAPINFGELGDTSDGLNPASSWIDNGLPKKLYCRKRQSGGGGISF